MLAHIIQDTQILREKYSTSTTITQKFKLIINLRKKKKKIDGVSINMEKIMLSLPLYTAKLSCLLHINSLNFKLFQMIVSILMER